MEFCRPEYWSGEHFSSPGDLPNPRIKPSSPTLQADSSPAEPQGEPSVLGATGNAGAKGAEEHGRGHPPLKGAAQTYKNAGAVMLGFQLVLTGDLAFKM